MKNFVIVIDALLVYNFFIPLFYPQIVSNMLTSH